MKKFLKNFSILLIFTMLITSVSNIAFAQQANNNIISSVLSKGVYIQSDSIPNGVNDLVKSKFQFLLEGVRQNPSVYQIQANQM